MYRMILTCIFMLILLTGCANMKTTQSLSNKERVSASRSHSIDQPLLSAAKNYKEQGNASWYGRKFHKKRTSSGERYNMYKLTAAHRTLPLSTHVKVTNLKNGRNVIVKINDRGPYVSDRLIDLSYAAAKKIGMLGRGTAYVEVKAVDAQA